MYSHSSYVWVLVNLAVRPSAAELDNVQQAVRPDAVELGNVCTTSYET